MDRAADGGDGVRSSGELMRAEDEGWNEFHSLVESLAPEQADRPGYFVEGWSVTDLVGHVGSWLAAAGSVLERIRGGTYRSGEIDVDAWNERFLDAMRGVSFRDARNQANAARARMLQAWRELGGTPEDAAFWIRKSGAEHYAEHLPRLREWTAELHAERGS